MKYGCRLLCQGPGAGKSSTCGTRTRRSCFPLDVFLDNFQDAATHVARHVLAITSGMVSRASAIRAEILPATGVDGTNTEKTEA